MDGPGPLLASLRAAFAPFDDEALASLANKGLVRRARKDLEGASPTVSSVEDDRLKLDLGDASVWLASPPTLSRCSCPATGVCRHILSALIFVRESAPEVGDATAEPPSEPAPSAIDEILAVDDAMLAKWAGKALVTRASKGLAFGPAPQVEDEGAVVVRFPERNVTCRWMPGGGLDGMICSCHAPEACEHRVAAILAVQAARGGRDLSLLAAAPEASTEAPRTRAEVLNSLGSVLRELVLPGTNRLSRATSGRLRTLAVSAHGVDLPRLERVIRALADEVEANLSRQAQADSSRLLFAAARLEALRHALLVRPTAALIGEHRSGYQAIADVELEGLGARAWRSRSGYAGLTVYFWDRLTKAWSTWTEARPISTGGFDPVARFGFDGPWSGLNSPSSASRSALRLLGAHRNRQGRLSGRSSTRAFITGTADPSRVPAINRWPDLVERATHLFGGFQDRDERDAIVLLSPSTWGLAQFDAVRQELVRPVLDVDGRPLPLVLRQTPENLVAIRTMESLDAREIRSVLGLLQFDEGRLVVEPIATHDASGVKSLTLDADHGRIVRSSPVPSSEESELDVVEDAEDELEVESPPRRPLSRVGGLIDRLASELETIGEVGFAAFRRIRELRASIAGAEALGLSACARSSARVVEFLERQRQGESIDEAEGARALLHAYYVARTALTQEALAVASSLMGRVAPDPPDRRDAARL